MRIHEDDHAYEVEKVIDPLTQVTSGWRYNIYRIRPDQVLLRSGRAATKEEAEQQGKEVLAEILERQRRKPAA